MDFPFFNGLRKKREQTVVIDLGTRTTKAITTVCSRFLRRPLKNGKSIFA